MIKKYLLLVMFGLLNLNGYAGDEPREVIQLNLMDVDKTPIGTPFPKSPMQTPLIYKVNKTLYFKEHHADWTLFLYDEDGNLVYSTFIPSETTQLILSENPGDYEIILTQGNYAFYGIINI